VPEDLADYLDECIEQLDVVRQTEVRVLFKDYLQEFAPTVRKDCSDAFLIEFHRFSNKAYLTNDTEFADYDRWSKLARAFARLVRSKQITKWIKTVLWSVKFMVEKDPQRRMVAHLTEQELDEILSLDCPEFLSAYLRSGVEQR
jgi:hypothetical protein